MIVNDFGIHFSLDLWAKNPELMLSMKGGLNKNE